MLRLIFEEMATGIINEYRAQSFTLSDLVYHVTLSNNTIIHLKGYRFISCTPLELEREITLI